MRFVFSIICFTLELCFQIIQGLITTTVKRGVKLTKKRNNGATWECQGL